MTIHVVQVNQELIDQELHSPGQCPVSQALRDIFHPDHYYASVGHQQTTVYRRSVGPGERHVALRLTHSRELTRWIENYDQNRRAEPTPLIVDTREKTINMTPIPEPTTAG